MLSKDIDEIITLPLFYEMADEQVERVICVVSEFFEKHTDVYMKNKNK